ncbi:cysteine rich repeat-containing protein [Bdellovibrio bacteriovorus]|uniref:cysteine rich repeat-containing protein n=1 Tax=Bdellovibrio bacteriovorus TaxID=959 RepID=UPI0021D3D0B1|nr:cysteine rich repeat-containing protein [Bdellovibrio bacteriovorus]UXR63763.1 cysteine rich repeat-containing protein [Bdellovibrio bacteriovorus]
MGKWIVVTVMLCFGMMSHAEEATSNACAKDRETLCGNVEPGAGRMMKCMRDNKDKLSAECKAHHAKMKSHMKAVKEACHDDVEKVCGDVQGGKGRIIKCMHDNKDKLSESCKAEMASGRKMRKGH